MRIVDCRKIRGWEKDAVQPYAVDVNFFKGQARLFVSTAITGGEFFDFNQGVWFDKEEARKVIGER